MSTRSKKKHAKTGSSPVPKNKVQEFQRHRRSGAKISESLMHRHGFHHGPINNTRKPHLPHGG